ncbi:hypothetical protein LJR034_006500 [Caballeronia sp. LjRoot34]|uniref:hypothetical protein n=1 Tax=Caballeronia sp. LjRoot34 TaxID=3342325 RepID=UPI001BD1E371
MDIFYYWKNYASDMKEGRVGTLGSEGDKLEELKQRLPRKVWTFVTPKGMKGKLQVVGSFLITETKPDTFVPKWKHNLFYDAASPKSVLYTNAATSERIKEVSDYFNNRFNSAVRSNFQGDRGVIEMEADVVRGFEKLVQGYETVQFMEGLSK